MTDAYSEHVVRNIMHFAQGFFSAQKDKNFLLRKSEKEGNCTNKFSETFIPKEYFKAVNFL